jgi:hypothetical protein
MNRATARSSYNAPTLFLTLMGQGVFSMNAFLFDYKPQTFGGIIQYASVQQTAMSRPALTFCTI